MYSISIARITRKVLAFVACTGAVLALTTGAALAGHCSGVSSVEIDAVSWDGTTLTVSGCVPPIRGSGSQDPVTVEDANHPGLVLGTANNIKKHGDWTVTSPTCAETVAAFHTSGNTTAINPDGCGSPVCTRNSPAISMGDDQFIAPDGSAEYTVSVTNNDTAACPSTTFNLASSDAGDTVSFDASVLSAGSVIVAPGATDNAETLTVTGNNTGVDGDALISTVEVRDDTDHLGQQQTDAVTTTIQVGVAGDPVANGDTYATPVGDTLRVEPTRLSGVLYNDRDPDGATGDPLQDLTAVLVDGPTSDDSFVFDADGKGGFTYTPSGLGDNDNDLFTYYAEDNDGNQSAVQKVNIAILSKQTDFKMMMNYELGMHCTGFEFAYCCVLPPYNSILTQIVKPAAGDPSQDPCVSTGCSDSINGNKNNFLDGFPRLMEGDANAGLDGLGRETVVRDFTTNGGFTKYQLKYTHDAQPRREGNGKPQDPNTLISDAEGNSLLYQDTTFDAGTTGAYGELNYGESPEGAWGVIIGDGDFNDANDNYANAWLNHFYIYAGLEGALLCVDDAAVHCETDDDCAGVPGPSGGACGNSQESNKTRLGIDVVYPKNTGAALHPMGPTGNVSGFDNVLTYSTDNGTVVYTQMKVLENLPVMLTSPRIWEALGLPLTPFEDSIKFFDDPGSVDEDSVRPYVAMKAALVEYPSGNAVFGNNGQPVIGFGTAPIDIPNCERCHSASACKDDTLSPGDVGCNISDPAEANINSPNLQRAAEMFPHTNGGVADGLGLEAVTNLEIEFWNSFYGIIEGVDSDWYSRLKGAAINMLTLHDIDSGTFFTANYPGNDTPPTLVQNTRLGKESVLCQRCHADNVIATVKSGCMVDPSSTVLCPDGAPGVRQIIPPITEAIHWKHRGTHEGGPISFSDALGRDGGCQGCHPAHRSDGVMDSYPITLDGDNALAGSDNRLALGGCFVGRDVHSNPFKDIDGAETPSHLNAVGQHLADTVFHNQGPDNDESRGIWCTNCHQQLSQEMWKAENVYDLINGKGVCVDADGNNDDGNNDGIPAQTCTVVADCTVAPFNDSCALNDVRALPSLAAIEAELGLSAGQAAAWLDPVDGAGDTTHSIWNPDVTTNTDAAVALIEATALTGQDGCGDRFAFFLPRFGASACLNFDSDPGGVIPPGDPSVRILDWCTTQDCQDAANALLASEGNGSFAFPAPFDAATDGRDHWLSPGEPHCADCHSAPYVEQSGNINPYPPFNYPRKASLMRYSRGHQDVTCQGCHESIHGLYPVTPTIDTTSYAQAAALNADGSHGPLKCETCHTHVDPLGVPTTVGQGGPFGAFTTFDEAVTWAHTYTDNANPVDSACQSCHAIGAGGVNPANISVTSKEYLIHAMVNRVSRKTMDLAEINQLGHVIGDAPDPRTTGLCETCHKNGKLREPKCNSTWRKHLAEGRVNEDAWLKVTDLQLGDGDPTTPPETCGW